MLTLELRPPGEEVLRRTLLPLPYLAQVPPQPSSHLLGGNPVLGRAHNAGELVEALQRYLALPDAERPLELASWHPDEGSPFDVDFWPIFLKLGHDLVTLQCSDWRIILGGSSGGYIEDSSAVFDGEVPQGSSFPRRYTVTGEHGLEGQLRMYGVEPESEGSLEKELWTFPGHWTFHLTSAKPGFHKPLFDHLGLHPPGLDPELRQLLLDRGPLAILFDTNALHTGALLPILRTRQGRWTHAALSDQTFMELQRHRELNLKGKDPTKYGPRERKRGYMVHTLVEQVRALGIPLHFVRPEPALVRYFGLGQKDLEPVTDDQDPPEAAPSFYQDRLILESLRCLQAELPGIPTVLVTSDVNFMLQVELEGFKAHLCWSSDLKDPAFFTSPWLDPRTLRMEHLPLRRFLESLIWYNGTITLEAQDQTETTLGLQTTRRAVALGLLHRGDPRRPPSVKHPLPSTPAPQPEPPPAPPPLPDLAARPPTTERLLQALLALEPVDDANLSNYLTHLGWLTPDARTWTPRGHELAEQGQGLHHTAALPWCAWMEQLAQDASKLPPFQNILSALSTGGLSEAVLVQRLDVGVKTLERQLRLATQLGVVVRHKETLLRPDELQNLQGAILELMREAQRRNVNRGTTIPIESLWATLSECAPTPPHRFRRAVVQLHTDGQIRCVGASPRSTEVRWSLPLTDGQGGVKVLQVNPGRGDFLIPGEPSQDLELIPSVL